MVEYVAYLQARCPDCMQLSVLDDRSWDSIDRYTYDKYIRCEFVSEPPRLCDWWKGAKLAHELTIKLNPRLSLEENKANLLKKLKQKIYDWVYNVKKNVEDAEKAEKIDKNPRFYGDDMLLVKLPTWIHKQVLVCRDFGEQSKSYYAYQDRYEVEISPSPGDPRGEKDDRVYFQADTLRELKQQIQYYKEDFSRPNWDY